MFGVEAFAGSLAQYSGAINMASTAFNVFGSLYRGKQEGEMADYEARTAAQQAQVEREVGEVRARRVRKAGEADLGRATAGYAGAGVEVGAGSAAFVAGELSSRIELDALTEILTGKRRGAALDETAKLKGKAADNARLSGVWGAGASLLGGFARQSEISRWNNRTQGLDARGYNTVGTRGPIGGTAADPWYG